MSDKRDAKKEWDTKVQESLKVATFLGSLTLGALPLIAQLKTPFDQQTFFSFKIIPPLFYKDILILFAGAASTLLITSVFGLKTVIVHDKPENKEFSTFAVISYEVGYLAVLILLPLLVASFSIYNTIPILIAEALWLIIFFRDERCLQALMTYFQRRKKK